MTLTAPASGWVKQTFPAMGTSVTSQVFSDSAGRMSGVIESTFDSVERTCSRFEPASDLVRANRAPHEWHRVSAECVQIVGCAFDAYTETKGLFDPRILTALVAAGYDRRFEDGLGNRPSAEPAPPAIRDPWCPQIDEARSRITLGSDPIDLGGIGKGWSVDRAAQHLRSTRVGSYMVNAGGDIAVRGGGPSGDGWTVAIEDPRDRTLTTAVLRLTDASCATSSTGLRRWSGHAGDERHHLIDPRTARPSQGGIRSVSVVAATTVTAETWTKALLIAGADAIDQLCTSRRLAAFWTLDDGQSLMSTAMRPYVIWQRSAA